jgi:hypothetical protein
MQIKKSDRMIMRRLFFIHICNQFYNNSSAKTEEQKMYQVSANQKIYNSTQRN